jgi:hypothetical protein
MKKEFLFTVCIFTCMMILVSACSTTSNLTPYTSPTTGEWRGENGSFTLLENGEIANLIWVLNAQEFQSRCPISLTENLDLVGGKADLTFTNTNTGKISFNISIIFTSSDTAMLTYMYDFCPSTSSIAFDESGETRTFTGDAEFQLEKP